MSVKSLVTFMRDPVGDKPWDEDEASKDVVHVPDSEVRPTAFFSVISREFFQMSFFLTLKHPENEENAHFSSQLNKSPIFLSSHKIVIFSLPNRLC